MKQEYVMLIANDVQLTPDAFNMMIEHMQAEDKIGVITPMLFINAGWSPRWYGERHAPEAQPLPWYEACEKRIDIPCEYVTMNLLLIRRQILEDGMRFDDIRFTFDKGDHDFVARIRNQGWTVLYCTHCHYYHPAPPGAAVRIMKGLPPAPPPKDYCKGKAPKPPSYPLRVDRLDVVTISYNQLPYLKRMINSLRFINIPYKLIIVDNGSERETIDYLNTLNDNVIYEEGNKGIFRALNICIEEALK